tara:strand:+ start:1514 stop:2005 length:492 start_codon:yes stop_codon:yes gene_type:complete
MKYCILFFYLITLLVQPNQVTAQPDHIVGEITEAEIRSTFRIFDLYTKRYQPDSTSIQYLSSVTDSISIITVMGTWCKDSRKHIPSLFKTLELANNPMLHSEYIAVDYSKKDPSNSYNTYKLKANPTILVFLNSVEIGRITEEPTQSIEKDLVKIIQSAPKNR